MNPKATTPKPETEPPSFRRGSGWIAGVLAFAFFTGYLFCIAVVPIRSDNDCWWHVKTGQYISEHGIPKHDVFAYTAADHVWNNHEWLSQLGFYHVWKLGEDVGFGGWRAVIVMIAVQLWLTYGLAFFLAARLSGSFWIALLVAAMAVAIGRRMFYPRPPVVSNLLMMAEIALLVAVNERWIRRAWVFVLIPVIALWSNLHGGWMAGGLILAAWMLGEVLRRVWSLGFAGWKGRNPDARVEDFFPIWWLGILGAGCVMATFANPFGIELYKLPGRVMSDKFLVSAIGELARPNYYFVIDFGIFAAAIFIMFLVSLRRQRVPLWEAIIWFFFLYQAMMHVRHLFLFSVAMVPLSTRVLAGCCSMAAGRLPLRARGILPGATVGLALYAMCWVIINPREGGAWLNPMSPRSYPGRNAQFAHGDGYNHDAYPKLVCDFIEEADLEGNMFNENYYAGYLIWRLSPEKHRVFSDSRFDIFGSKFLLYEKVIASGASVQLEDGKRLQWDELLALYDIQWAITRSDTGLHDQFMASKDWGLVARWPQELGGWEIWVLHTPKNEAMVSRAKKAAADALAFAPQ
ncbi:hypothetical protein IT570_03700 [Candidatus Sumerlaeota bacterium]|nr:hypothetical protein [Candidatus Sumerlaeota bacterium]